MLGQRPHFRDDLRRKLLHKGFEAAEVDEALARLAAAGYLDDRQLATEEAGRLRDRKALSRAGVAADLARRGAGRAAIDAALAGDDAAAELERAREAGRRAFARGRRDAAALGRVLSRKGYAAHVIFRILNELVPEAADAETPLDPE